MALEHEASLLADTTFWVLIATIVFAFVGYKYGRSSVLSALDSRTDKIRSNIEEAEKLRVEAQELLAEYQRKHRDAMNESEEIIANAKRQAKELKKEAAQRLENSLQRHEKQAQEKIKQAEETAVQEIKEQIVDIASAAAGDILNKHNSGKEGDKSVDESIDALKKAIG